MQRQNARPCFAFSALSRRLDIGRSLRRFRRVEARSLSLWFLIAAASGTLAVGTSPIEDQSKTHPQRLTLAQGVVTFEFDSDVLGMLGLEVIGKSDIGTGARLESRAISFAATIDPTGDLRIEPISPGLLSPGVSGTVRARAGLIVLADGKRVAIPNPTLSLVGDRWALTSSSTPPGFGAASDATPLFELVGAKTWLRNGDSKPAPGEANPGPTFRLTATLVVTDALAHELDAPHAAGVAVGRVILSGLAVSRVTGRSLQPSKDIESSGLDTHPAPFDPGRAAGGIGPDIIVHDLYQVLNYGAVDGIAALSIGTISCNVGDEPAIWISNNNQHPVIAQNLYRLKDGKFEQIGMSWLKHGFFALNGRDCFSNCQGTDGTALGVHCSDPYSANLNGSQSNLGPHWQVNAYTGYFPFPPASPSYSTTIARRLQVRTSDLDQALNAGAAYFLEGHYVTPDDAAAGNQDNNASYRPASVSGAGASVFVRPAGTTQRRQPAIRAWQDTDPSVIETDIHVPGEGLFIIAAKTTDLGDGYWAYEYAVANVNSDRSAGSFRVSIDSTTTIRNIRFHDVDYHSGEPLDGADWTAAVNDVAITWSTVTYEQNEFANALRWGTLYNFRFEANQEPQPTRVVLGLFKPGTPSFVEAVSIGPINNTRDCNGNGIPDSVDLANGASLDCNDNGIPDECESYEPVTVRVASGLDRPVYATAPPGDFARLFIVEQPGRIRILSAGIVLPTPFLDISSRITSEGEQGLLSMAFSPGYDADGLFFVDYTDSAGNTVIASYTVSADPNRADAASERVLKTISQDFVNHNGGQLQFGPNGYLYVGVGDGGSAFDPNNRAQDTGSLLGKILRLDVNRPPDYIPVNNPFLATTLPLDEIWGLGLRNPWRFSFDRLTGDLYIADLGQNAVEEINFQPAGGGGENYGWRCMEGTRCTGLSGCTCGSSALTAPIHTYEHAGADCAVTGGYVYRGCALPNLRGTYFYADYCSGAIRSFRYQDGGVSELRDHTDGLTPAQGPIRNIVSFAQDAAGELYVISHDGDIYKIIPNPAVCGNGILEPGETCDDGNTLPGDGCDVTCGLEPGAASDACADRQVIGEGAYPFDTTGASTDGPDEPEACTFAGDSQVGSDVWYCYRASCTGTATVSLCPSGYDTKLAVYVGCSCPVSASALACNDDSCGSGSQLSFDVAACDSYLIRIGGYNGAQGSGTMTITCNPDPIETDCNGNGVDDAVDVACGTSGDGNGNGVPDECESDGDPILGGRLYDRWWAEVSAAPPDGDHPLWGDRPDPVNNTATGAATWRCKECHGWDYKGLDGRYATGPHRTGFPGVLHTTLDAVDLFTLLREPPDNGGQAGIPNGHDYATVLPDTRINDLVAFILSGPIDDDPFIDPQTGDFLGDPVAGQTLYNSAGSPACIACHGADGTGINFGSFLQPEYVGTIAVKNPWELLHKVRFGQPGAPMPSWLQGGGSNQQVAHIGRYAQLNFPVDCVDDAPCDDTIDCTSDTCNSEGRCSSTADDALCIDDDVFCNGPEVCQPLLGCVTAGFPCTGPCSEATGCLCEAPRVAAPGCRYLAVTPQPPDAAFPVGLVITPRCELGVPGYIGEPEGPYNVARVTDTPGAHAVLTPGEWGGTVYITGLEIVPDTLYDVQVDCGLPGAPQLSPVTTVTTQLWGDVAGIISESGTILPDGNISFTDIGAVVDAFRSVPTAPPLYATDLFGCVPDQSINFTDIGGAVDAFKSRPYSVYSRCAYPCR